MIGALTAASITFAACAVAFGSFAYDIGKTGHRGAYRLAVILGGAGTAILSLLVFWENIP